MVVHGHVENGKIVLDENAPLAEGVKVRIEFMQADSAKVDKSTETPSLYDRMKGFIGSLEGLPSDLAINHDHYLHGQPKRQ